MFVPQSEAGIHISPGLRPWSQPASDRGRSAPKAPFGKATIRVFAEERLSTQRGGVEGPCQAPQSKAFAQSMKASRNRDLCRDPFKSVAPDDTLYLPYAEPGRQRGIAPKRAYLSPSALALDIGSERTKRMQHMVAHRAGPA